MIQVTGVMCIYVFIFHIHHPIRAGTLPPGTRTTRYYQYTDHRFKKDSYSSKAHNKANLWHLTTTKTTCKKKTHYKNHLNSGALGPSLSREVGISRGSILTPERRSRLLLSQIINIPMHRVIRAPAAPKQAVVMRAGSYRGAS